MFVNGFRMKNIVSSLKSNGLCCDVRNQTIVVLT